MAWLSIILALINAIPSLFKIMQMIRDLLKGQPKEVKASYAREFKGVLSRWKEHRDAVKATGEVKFMLTALQNAAKRGEV